MSEMTTKCARTNRKKEFAGRHRPILEFWMKVVTT